MQKSDHPAIWELDWIDDPKNQPRYEGHYRRMRVKEAIALRTSLRCLNGTSAKIVTDKLTPNYNCVPHRRVDLEYLDQKYIVRVMIYHAKSFLINSFFGEKKSDSSPGTVAIHEDHAILHLSKLMQEELGGKVLASEMDPTRVRREHVYLANKFNGLIVSYAISAVSSF